MHPILKKTLIAAAIFQACYGAAYATPLGALRKLTPASEASEVGLETDSGDIVQIHLLKPDVFRVQAGRKGHLTDAGNKAAPIVVKTDYSKVDYQLSDRGDYQLLQTQAMALRLYKKPLRMALYRADNKTPVWQETQPLELGDKASYQTLSSSPDESFFGGGQQNGGYAFKGKTMEISYSGGW
jgi:hypothetical protein